jgi:DNA polymerase elongation subunit (family B)
MRKAVVYNGYEILIDENKLELFNVPELQYEDIEPFNTLEPWDEKIKLYVDIETEGLNKFEHRVKSIGLKYSTGEYFFFYGHDEGKILTEFLIQLYKIKAYCLITHNGFNFDLPFLEQRFLINDLPFPFNRSEKERRVTSSSFHGRPITYFPYTFVGYKLHLIDTLVQCCIWDKQASKLESYGLKNAVIALGLRTERRTELTYQQMLECYATDNWDLLNEYLKYDLDDTELLANRVIPSYYYQMKWVPNVSFEYICVASPALKVQKIHEKLIKNGSLKPQEKHDFKGGISEVINPGIYNNVCKIDVTSLYPSLMLKYGLCSKKDKNRLFLNVLNKIKTERIKLKVSPQPEHQYEQEALKILANGSFGFFGTGMYSYNDYECSALVTAYGRRILRLMQAIAEENNGKVIEIDTDGLYIQSDQPDLIYTSIQRALPSGINVELEIENAVAYIPKAKNYIIIYEKKGKEVVLAKGIYKKRNRIKLLNQFCINLVRSYMSKGKKSSTSYFLDLVKKLKNSEIDYELLFTTRKISVSEKKLVELGIGNPGETVKFLYRSENKYHKKTGRLLRKEYIPTTDYENHDPEYYIRELGKFYFEIFPEDKIQKKENKIKLIKVDV